jgi:hypothetical protein
MSQMHANKIPLTYTASDTWYFEAEFDGMIHCLEINPQKNCYSLLCANVEGGNGKTTEGSVNELLAQIPDSDPQPYYKWLKGAIAYEYWNSDFEDWDKLDKIFYGRNSCCWVRSNVRTGKIEIAFPTMVILSARLLITENFRQIHSIKKGKLHELLMMFLDTNYLNNNTEPNTSLPAYNESELTEFEIESLKIGMAYDDTKDIIFLHLGEYIEVTHANTIFDDVWEISTIDEGRFKEELAETLAKRGFAKIWELSGMAAI